MTVWECGKMGWLQWDGGAEGLEGYRDLRWKVERGKGQVENLQQQKGTSQQTDCQMALRMSLMNRPTRMEERTKRLCAEQHRKDRTRWTTRCRGAAVKCSNLGWWGSSFRRNLTASSSTLRAGRDQRSVRDVEEVSGEGGQKEKGKRERKLQRSPEETHQFQMFGDEIWARHREDDEEEEEIILVGLLPE